jgi:hypothetical protein
MDAKITMRYLLYGLTTFTLTLFPLTSRAQDADARTQELERKLKERDMVILELLERVETLERRVGVEPIGAQSSQSSTDVMEPDLVPDTEKNIRETSEAAPGTVVVRESEVERALERSLTRAGVLLLPSGFLEIEPALNYSRQEDSIVSLIMSDSQLVAADTELNANTLSADLELRLGLPWDSQLEVGLPYQWRNVESVNSFGFMPIGSSSLSGSALGDIRLGLAKTLLREGLWRPDVVGRLTWDTASGEREDNGVPFGGGFNELRGFLSAIKRQDPIAIVGGLTYEYSFEDSQIKPGQFIGASFGSFIALSPETSMRFLFSGGYQYESELAGDTIAGSDRTLGTFIIGGTTLLAPGLLFNLSVNVGLTDDADDFGISVSLPFRFDSPLY